MRLLYLDCVSGASGDMLLGALIDAGASPAAIETTLRTLPLPDWSWQVQEVRRGALRATQVCIEARDVEAAHGRRLRDVEVVLDAGQLPAGVRKRAGAVFQRIGEAEARVHGGAVESLRLHHVGEADSVLDVTGVLLALEALGVERVSCSALPLAATGEVESGHGRVPAPAPATLEILSAVAAPLRPADPADRHELVTPTGAAIVAELAVFERPALRLQRIGAGAGARELPHRPNILRAWLGEGAPAAKAGIDVRSVVVLETTVDDMTAEQMAFARDRIAAAGALDVWIQAAAMKKGRSGLHVTVIARPQQEEELARLLLRETSTLGVRVREERRYEAPRLHRSVDTRLGPAGVKLKRLPGEPVQIAPEFDDCARLAEEHGLPIADVYALVEREAREQLEAE